MHLDIITPEKKVFSAEVISVTVQGTEGQFQVLNGHAAIVSTLEKGPIKVKTSNAEIEYQAEGGVVEVLNNKVIVLVEHATGGNEAD
ncbi:MAG: synthase subunit epsilon [Bacteroidota bacterium]|jgi:F-type H+-transporting ATPase subunit epsilon